MGRVVIIEPFHFYGPVRLNPVFMGNRWVGSKWAKLTCFATPRYRYGYGEFSTFSIEYRDEYGDIHIRSVSVLILIIPVLV